jgi:hypothetical protein
MKHDRFSLDIRLFNDENWDFELSNNSDIDVYIRTNNNSQLNRPVSCLDNFDILAISSEVDLEVIWECEISIFNGVI